MKVNQVIQFTEEHKWCGCLGIIYEALKCGEDIRYMVGVPVPEKGMAMIFVMESEKAIEKVSEAVLVWRDKKMNSYPKLKEWTKEEILNQIKNGEIDNEFIAEYISKRDRVYNKLIDVIDELKIKHDKTLEMLSEHSIPCEIDGFMDKNVDYCSRNCGVDEEVYKKCWDRFIEQKIKNNS